MASGETWTVKELLPLTPEELAIAEDRLFNPAPGSRIEAAAKYGVDLSLLLAQLRLTPAERGRKLERVTRGLTKGSWNRACESDGGSPARLEDEGAPFMPTRNVILTEHFDRFVESGVTSGRFSDASEVVCEGLRLLEQREQENKAKIEGLRTAAKEGFDAIERGDYVALNSEEELDAFLGRIREELASELASEPKRG